MRLIFYPLRTGNAQLQLNRLDIPGEMLKKIENKQLPLYALYYNDFLYKSYKCSLYMLWRL